MKFKLICCEVLMREACLALALSPHVTDPEFTPKGAHENSEKLRELIQKKIDDTVETGGYDAILLGFGLCGNSTEGIRARSIPIVIPRAHDCCTIFLGSKEKFMTHFKDNLSSEWSSAGYMERGDSYLRETDTGKLLGTDRSYRDMVEQYGEENARYIWDTLHPPKDNKEVLYIEIPETAHLGYLKKIEVMAAEKDQTVKVIDGDIRLIRKLLSGEWDEAEFLYVKPGQTIAAVYDYEYVLTAR